MYKEVSLLKNFMEKFKALFSEDAALKRVPLYFLVTCVLLVVLIFKLNQTNIYLQEIAANGTNAIELETDENYNSVAEVFVEGTKAAEDIIPMLNETSTESTTAESSTKESETKSNTTTTTVNSTNNTNTNTNANTTATTTTNTSAESKKVTYVINISSKKIHLADCSFVSRTKEENKKTVQLTAAELEEYLNNGYTLCKTCGGK